MSPISTPNKRAYYPASPKEKDRLLLWIPRGELEGMVEGNVIPQAVLQDYPDGLEIEVTPSSFGEFGIDMGVRPEALIVVYKHLLEGGQLPPSGIVDGETLERVAMETLESDDEETHLPIEVELPEPEMTDGEEAPTFLRGLE